MWIAYWKTGYDIKWHTDIYAWNKSAIPQHAEERAVL